MIRSVVNCINKYMQKLTKQENTIEDFPPLINSRHLQKDIIVHTMS